MVFSIVCMTLCKGGRKSLRCVKIMQYPDLAASLTDSRMYCMPGEITAGVRIQSSAWRISTGPACVMEFLSMFVAFSV